MFSRFFVVIFLVVVVIRRLCRIYLHRRLYRFSKREMKIDTKCEAHVIRAKCTLEQTHHHTDKDESHIIVAPLYGIVRAGEVCDACKTVSCGR